MLIPVIYKLLIDFIRYNEYIMLDARLTDCTQFFFGVQHPCRIARGIEYEGFCLG